MSSCYLCHKSASEPCLHIACPRRSSPAGVMVSKADARFDGIDTTGFTPVSEAEYAAVLREKAQHPVTDDPGKAQRHGHGKDEPLYVIFDGPPSHNSPRFIEIETADGKSIRVGEWRACRDPNRGRTYWSLGPFYTSPAPKPESETVALLRECYEWLFESMADGPRVSEGALDNGSYTPAFRDLHNRLRAALTTEGQKEPPSHTDLMVTPESIPADLGKGDPLVDPK